MIIAFLVVFILSFVLAAVIVFANRDDLFEDPYNKRWSREELPKEVIRGRKLANLRKIIMINFAFPLIVTAFIGGFLGLIEIICYKQKVASLEAKSITYQQALLSDDLSGLEKVQIVEGIAEFNKDLAEYQAYVKTWGCHLPKDILYVQLVEIP